MHRPVLLLTGLISGFGPAMTWIVFATDGTPAESMTKSM